MQEAAAQKDISQARPQTEGTFNSMPAMFYWRAKQSANEPAFRFLKNGSWQTVTWRETEQEVREIAAGLVDLGLELEQRCSILSGTRYEWAIVDLAIMCGGGATTTIYPSNTPDECAYIIKDSETFLCFAEDESQLAKLKEEKSQLSSLKYAILFDGTSNEDWVLTLDELRDKGKKKLESDANCLEEVEQKLDPEKLATLIYTSGTTGRPKGVRLVHDNWIYEGTVIDELGILSQQDLQFLWLPLAHSFGKCLLASHVATGYETAIDGDIPKLVDNLAVIRPTFMAAAPRIFEKVYNKVISGAKEAGGLKYKIFTWSLGVGRKVSQLRQQGKKPGGLLAAKYKIANKLVFSKLKDKFGGRVRFFISGSAPLSRDIAEFFHAADILILEGYGLTESSAAAFVNVPSKYKFGTVGPALPGTEIKFAEEDNEIWLKGRNIMRGYHNLPDKTAEVLQDGWLLTGDIGEMDSGGLLKITDRKKDLIKTSGGKYVAPQNLEGKFKAVCPLASQIVVHGDKRNYCVALIALDEEALMNWAKDNGRGHKSYQELTEDDAVVAEIQRYVDKLNSGLASYETVKYFKLLPKDMTVEDGELTPSLKVKRKAVEKQYMDLLDGMYEDTLASM